VRALLSSFIFQHLQIDSRSRPQVLACQSFFLLTLAFYSVQISSTKTPAPKLSTF